MDSLDKKNIPLSIEKCEIFKPKSNNYFIQRKMSKGQESIEDSENLINSQRKSSTDSTSNSKIEDLPEITNFSSLNINTNYESFNEKEIFFGRDKNNQNPIYNFYQSTEEYFLEKLTENKKYKNTKNYILKLDLYSKKINNKIQEDNIIEKRTNKNMNNLTLDNNNENNSNVNIKNINTNQMPSLMGTYLSAIPNTNIRGKFDMPMYYIGFYRLNSKLYLFYFYKKYFFYRFE